MVGLAPAAERADFLGRGAAADGDVGPTMLGRCLFFHWILVVSKPLGGCALSQPQAAPQARRAFCSCEQDSVVTTGACCGRY
mmetsp:Transcript_11513/g.25499  ORF Transcript_11513/g.25499 Transcript_11513/m.25499 type:complete len:82 (+) Transcript_11513:921-1166(+)